MVEKIKNMSIGKKVYSIFWTITGILLITLIGLFTGLKDSMGESTPPKDGWTIKAEDKKDDYIKGITADANITNNLLRTTGAGDNYWIKDKTSTPLKTDDELLTLARVAVLAVPSITDSEKTKIEILKTLDDFKHFVNNLETVWAEHPEIDGKPTSVKNVAAIKAMNDVLYSTDNIKYEKMSIAKKTANFPKSYDASYAMYREGTDDASKIYLEPLIVPTYNAGNPSNNIKPSYTKGTPISGSFLNVGDWNTTPTKSAKYDKNITAGFGFVFMGSLIAAVFSTVYVSVKEKGGKK